MLDEPDTKVDYVDRHSYGGAATSRDTSTPTPTPEAPMNPDLLRGNLELIVLTILERQPLYGFAIIQEARDRTGGYLDFKEGSLYPALHRMEQDGLLAAQYGEAGRNGKPRKYYAITDKGRQALTAKRQEFNTFTQAVTRLAGL